MNKQTFIQLIKNPSDISPAQAEELEKVVAGFPYCQSAYILLAKQASDSGSMFADQKIKKAAAYTLDRKNLKRLLTSKVLKTIPIDTPSVEISNKPIEQPVKLEEESTLISTRPKPGLSDIERDTIIKELQENLKRLHTNKIKAAWDEVPEEHTLTNTTTIKNIEPNTLIEDEKVEKTEDKTEKTKQESFIHEPIGNSFVSMTSFPLRNEERLPSESLLYLDYLIYLDEKRGVFRKNKKKEEGIINKFIKKDPKIPKLDKNNLPDNSVDLSFKSSQNTKQPISENFAKILSLQGKYEKAITIYEELCLKMPEKKAYFEAQIEKLKNKL